MSDINTILSDVWGYTSFRAGQEEIINHLLQKKSVLAIMPTGGGKSLCFQIPALLFENQTIVVSPLVSLMNNQVIALKDVGVKAERVHSDMPDEDRIKAWEDFKKGDIKIMYISPESLMQQSILSELKPLRISMFVIDEAHCISTWGHDFRPDHKLLTKRTIPSLNQDASVLFCTATADEKVVEDISKKNNLTSVIAGDLYRKSLSIHSFGEQSFKFSIAITCFPSRNLCLILFFLISITLYSFLQTLDT